MLRLSSTKPKLGLKSLTHELKAAFLVLPDEPPLLGYSAVVPSAPPDTDQVFYCVQIPQPYWVVFAKICKTQSLPSRNLQVKRGDKYTNNNNTGERCIFALLYMCTLIKEHN